MKYHNSEESKLGYVTDYTSGIYLSGIIILILSIIGIIVTLRIPYEAYIMYSDIMLDLLFSGVVGVILSLLFLLIKRKIIYLVFLSFLVIGLVSKIFLLHWLYTMSGRVGGIGTGIGLPLLIIIYLALKYKSVFIPVDIPVEKNEKIEPSRIWYFLPVFLGIFGGLIGFFALKNRNWKMAKTVFGLGIAMSVLAVGASSIISLMQPKSITCDSPTDNFASGCELLLHYDKDNDGLINLDELNKCYSDFNEDGVATKEEFDFVADAYINDGINAVCPSCFITTPTTPTPTPTPTPISCWNPTPHFSSGCELLLHYDGGGDGKIQLEELSKSYDDYEDRVITEEEFDFVSDAYINHGINVVCPDCFEGTKNKVNQKVRALAQESQCDWTGTWNTTFGEMRLFQDGYLVVGDYEYRDGKIVGKISGYTLMGTWFEGLLYTPPNSVRDFEFTIPPDCDSFTGRWRFGSTGNWSSWTGKRITPILTLVDSDGDEVPDQYDYAPYDSNVQSKNDIKAPEVLIDADNDGVPDQYDYAPRDPYVQTKSDIKTPGFEAVFTIVGLLVVVYLLSRRK